MIKHKGVNWDVLVEQGEENADSCDQTLEEDGKYPEERKGRQKKQLIQNALHICTGLNSL